MKPKTNVSQVETEFADEAFIKSVGKENFSFASLNSSLAEIRKLKGVIGYILRSNTSAIIDLAEPEKIIQYALLSSQINDSCQEISKQLNLGETESMLVEGEKVKVLCMYLGVNKLSVFLERTATHAWIIKRFLQ